MSSISYQPFTGTQSGASTDGLRPWYPVVLLGIVLAVDTLAPFLILNAGIPGGVRWLSDLVIAVILATTILQLFLFDKIPAGILVIFAFSIVSIVVASHEGQSWQATTWGWWRMFRYPMLAVFVYIQPTWPRNYAKYFFRFCLAMITFQMLVQIGQYLAGTIPGDHLSGTFGRFGVGPLALVLFFTLSLAFGHWLETEDPKSLALVCIVGAVASVLGEMKMYFPVVMLFAGIAMAVYALQGGNYIKLLSYAAFFVIIAVAFVNLYGALVSDTRGTRRLEEYIFSAETRQSYVGSVAYDPNSAQYEFGRAFAVRYGWERLQRDSTTLLFGVGIGARSESKSLGIVGSALETDFYGLEGGTSLLVLMHETGVVGLLLFGLFCLYVSQKFLRAIPKNPDRPYLNTLFWGMTLFTLFWPLWLWYHQVWVFSAMMVLYWSTIGYLMRESGEGQSVHQDQSGW